MRFFRLTELATLLMEARDERSLLGLKARLAKLDLLVLDELGYVPASKIGAELLFDVISSAYERCSLIVTTNLPFESWTEVCFERSRERPSTGSPTAARSSRPRARATVCVTLRPRCARKAQPRMAAQATATDLAATPWKEVRQAAKIGPQC